MLKGIIIEKFGSIQLSKELIKALKEEGYENPTSIQKKAIPVLLNKKDLIAAAKSGTGKTAAFLLPMLEQLKQEIDYNKKRVPRVLIIVPTRELVKQIHRNISNYSRHLDIKHATAFGGVSNKLQADKIKKGVDIIVATPGRLLDHIENNVFSISSVNRVVLDEADTILEMGFIEEVEKILTQISTYRQISMFSATISQNVKKLAKEFLDNPTVIELTDVRQRVDLIEHSAYKVDSFRKIEMLSFLIGSQNYHKVLVFVNTKKTADEITQHFNLDGLPTLCIHGDIKQSARGKALRDFKSGKIRVLVATDIAARGIDIEELPYVVNFELPQSTDDFTHRVGRTGRAGNKGNAITLVCAKEYKQLETIEKDLMITIKRLVLDGFELTEKQPKIFKKKKKKLTQKKKETTKPIKKVASKKTTKRDANRNFRRK
ncbi:DEAD-box ATP-dependent RNA helicase [Malaciobacter halophilus]|uniref:DEAD/DEAH box helicase n=1 Tax=Malaciobacter halophilus TaxID=197482 RepID=UPI000E0FFE8C|nr:DEAD/DEAH box helicase [Malaciobacter halophilus]AXH10265.1 DEAD-box ATP-dependent RNA helicase [Malaciobacter halophilus]